MTTLQDHAHRLAGALQARVDELEARVTWLSGELGEAETLTRIAALQRGLRLPSVSCSPTDARLVLALYHAAPNFLSRDRLEALMSDWNGRDELTRKLLHVRVWRLRRLMGRAAIENSWGGGYRLTPAAAGLVGQLLGVEERWAG